jgi:hypothetical protein
LDSYKYGNQEKWMILTNKQNFTRTKPTIHNVHENSKLHCRLQNKDLVEYPNPVSGAGDASAF